MVKSEIRKARDKINVNQNSCFQSDARVYTAKWSALHRPQKLFLSVGSLAVNGLQGFRGLGNSLLRQGFLLGMIFPFSRYCPYQPLSVNPRREETPFFLGRVLDPHTNRNSLPIRNVGTKGVLINILPL